MTKKKKKTPYETLGVDKNATPKEIEKAFRKKARKTHPDAGGDEREFKKINNAYAILSVPEKRERYDQYEDEDPETPEPTNVPLSMLADAMLKLIANGYDVERTDFVSAIRDFTKKAMAELRDEIKSMSSAVKKLKKSVDKFKKKGDGENLLSSMAERQAVRLEGLIKENETALKFREESLAILKEYEYEFEKQLFTPGSWRSTFNTFTMRKEDWLGTFPEKDEEDG